MMLELKSLFSTFPIRVNIPPIIDLISTTLANLVPSWKMMCLNAKLGQGLV
jgi:hypothetical protein